MSTEPFLRDIQEMNSRLGREAFSPCYEVFLCGTSERKSFRPAILAGLGEIAERFGQSMKWYKTNTMKWPKRLSADAQELAGNFFDSIIAKPPKLAGIQFHSGVTNEEYKVPSVAFFSTIVPTELADTRSSRTYLRLCIPSNVDDVTSMLREMSRTIITGCPVYSGHCGWSYYWSVVDSEEEQFLEGKVSSWHKRYPGLFYGDPLSFLEFIGDGILSVSWLTYIGREAIESRGESLETVAARLRNRGIRAELLGEQVLEIQATQEPELGDRNRNDLLTGYSQVGRELMFLGLTEEQAAYLPILGLDREERWEWYSRFFGEE